MIRLLVEGVEDEGGKVHMVSFIEAGRACGINPDVARKALGRSDVQTLLRHERRTFLASVVAGNPKALQQVRDEGSNAMAKVAATRALEEMGAEHGVVDGRPSGHLNQSPGVTIIIQSAPAAPTITIDAQADGPLLRGAAEPLEFEPAPPPRLRPEEGDYPIFRPDHTA
jgi:hypothetical protein